MRRHKEGHKGGFIPGNARTRKGGSSSNPTLARTREVTARQTQHPEKENWKLLERRIRPG